MDERGDIVVDDQLQTSVPGVWTLGDCNGKGAFTHTSYNDYEIVAANLLDSDPRRVSDRTLAYGLYIDPPLGPVGMTEAEVRRSARKALIGKRPMTRVGRAVEKGETQGFMKILVDAETKEILGGAVLGVGGRRDHPLRPGRDVRQGSLHRDPAGRTYSPYGDRADPHHARRSQAAGMSLYGPIRSASALRGT